MIRRMVNKTRLIAVQTCFADAWAHMRVVFFLVKEIIIKILQGYKCYILGFL